MDIFTRRFMGPLGPWSADQVTVAIVAAASLCMLSAVGLGIYRVWFHPLSVFPGPKHLAVSNISEQWKSHVRGNWIYEVADLHRRYGPIVRTGPNRIALDGTIGWPQVFAHKSGMPEFTKCPDFVFKGDSHSLIGSCTTENHRRQRRTLAHAFSDAALKEQEAIITKYIDLLLNQLGKYTESGDAINIVDWLNFTTFDIIGDLTFSDPFHSLEGGAYAPFVRNFFRGIRGIARQRLITFYPLLRPVIYFMFGNKDFVIEQETREMSMSKAQSRMAFGAEPKDGRRDLSSYMLAKDRDGNKKLTDHEILVNSPILVGAGSETTATALSGFTFYVGNSPIVYERLAREIRETFKEESEINMNSAGRLEYLHAVLEETLRVYPPAAETPPRISPGAYIEGKWIPKGTYCSVYQWATFRNPENFANPDSFVPERWLPASHPLHDPIYLNDNKAVFKPFSFGSRDCIGKNLAYSEMRVVAARLMHRFDFELAPGQEKWHESQHTFVVWSKGALNVHLRPRTKAN
ncbi:cytochrome P450 [Pestalotiopsis sp. NC0098]|nr:cytochrome P450 [Pestalotiopsis sp. NC0098]